MLDNHVSEVPAQVAQNLAPLPRTPGRMEIDVVSIGPIATKNS